MIAQRRPGRVRAPELRGRGWLNTDPAEPALTLRGLRGRFVLLDFWTFCCVNCLHVIDELRSVEAQFAEELVVVGVHSPKFAHEGDPAALADAVERYAVQHPVLDDPELVTWRAYTARAWPTLVLVDPQGYVVEHYTGEGHAHAISVLLETLVAEHRERGTLQPAGSPYLPASLPSGSEPGDLRFPVTALSLPDGRVLVVDAGHDEVVELAPPPAAGRAGRDRRLAGFREPNGLCLLPPEVAARVGYDVVVADTGHHQLRGLSLVPWEVRVLAGDGAPWRPGDGTERLSSPWDVVWWPADSRVWIAMAGIHQLWALDPVTGHLEVVAGTTAEGLLDGPAAQAWLAQTSGLAPDGDRLWLVDAETSALRWIERADGGSGAAGATYQVHTAVGQGLFDFGWRDGPVAEALLQHPLGVTVLPDGSVAVCDTYNGAVRRFDPATVTMTTLADGLAEPSGAYVDGPDLVVVESAAHVLTRIPLGGGAASVSGFAHTTGRAVSEVSADVELVIAFEPPPGQRVDDRYGPPSQLVVGATPAALIRAGDGRAPALTRTLSLDPVVGEGVLHVSARAASCDVAGPDGEVPEGAACHLHQQDWELPVRVVPAGLRRLELPLGGVSRG